MRSTNGRRALCLCAVALGLMAFSASAAQASTWMVNGTNLTSGGKAVTAKIVGTSASLLTKIAGLHVKYLCKNGQVSNLQLTPSAGLSAGFQITFTGCTMTIKTKKEEELGESGKVSAACEPHVGAEKGVIKTNKLKGQLKEHATGEGVTVIEAESGETLATMEMGEECAIGETVPIIGKLGIVDSGGMAGLLAETKVHNIKEGPLTELWAISKTEEHKAKLEGELALELVSGELWNGLLP